MKTKNIIQRLSLFLFALVLAAPTWAQGTEVVSISSAADWKTFCQRVNDNGEPFLNAKLTQDVDLGGEIVMLGSVSYPYSGTFDGQGHTLKFNWNAGEDNQIAPFYYVENATIKNLRTQGKITSKGNGLSGMVYAALGTTTISGCISDVDITGGNGGWNDSRAAGMVQAVAYGASVQITDCLVKGSITDNADEDDRAMAGFVLSNSGTYTLTRCLYVGKNNAANSKYSKTFGTEKGISAIFTDCYYLNTCGKAQGDKITEAQLRNGYVAYMLQGKRTDMAWGQKIGTDKEPLPTDKVAKHVYKVAFTYNGKEVASRYANRGGNVGTLPTPQEILGVAYNTANTYKLVFADGFYAEYPIYADRTVAVDVIVNNMCEIATKEDWKKFGDLVRSGERNLNAKLTVDLDFGSDIQKIGSESTGYSGTFDGQGHTITIDWNAHGTDTYVALFPFVTNATIKNLRVTGKMTSDSQPLSVFSLAARGTTTYEHCISDVKITSGNKSSSYCAAGMVLSAHPESKITFNDCIVAGDINGTVDNSQQNMGGFVSAQADDATCTFNNCLYTGTNNAKGGYAFAPKPTLNNCYYVNAFANVQGTPTTAEQLASGYVAWMLQSGRAENVWGQTLGTDATPLPTDKADKRIYRVQFTHNGKEVALRYANNGQGIHGTLPTAEELLGAGYNPKLTYALNFGDFTANTPVTADKTVDVTVTVSGTFPIATAADWKEFCDLVESGQTRIDAKLTQDVDLCKEINTVGNSIEQYKGTFDGQGHTLSFDWTSQGGFAPFDFVNSGTIKNLRTKGKITTSSGEASGLLGNAYGATTISNCVSDVEITSSIDWDACKAAGLVQTVGYNGKVTVTDCVVKGNINATTEKGQKGMAGFVYELGDGGACTLTNCLYVGENNGTENSYTFAPAGVTLNNCYYLNPCGEAQGTPTTAEQLASGYVAWMLQSGRAENVWGQTLGTDATPLPTDKADKRVCKVEFTYDNKVAAVRYANRGGNVTLPTAKDILGPAYDAAKTYALTFSGGFSETTVINSDEQVQAYINGTTTGIDGVTHDATDTRGAVYNLQGVRVAESSDAETLRRLPAGVYVVRGKKFVVR